MQICYGWARKLLNLSSEQRYHPEQLLARLGPFCPERQKPVSPLLWMPVWVLLDGVYVRLHSRQEVELACKLVCIYHNGPDCKAPPSEDDTDWYNVTHKEAFRTRTPESSSDEEAGAFV